MDNLIKKAKAQDPDAFTALMQSQMRNMYRTARAILMNDEDAADAIQETILTCWEKMKDLKEDKYFQTWVTRILINKCYEIIRNNKDVMYVDTLPEQVGEDSTDNLEWKEALSALDEKYRLVLVLFYCEGFHTKEIAKMLKLPNATVRTRLARGRKQLAEYYKDDSYSRKEQIG